MTVEQQIVEVLHGLPPGQQTEVLDFAAFLRHRLECVPIAQHAELTPLPVLSGQITAGWKEAIYDHS